jgi:alpha-beta hydrolase superfamily lysophospholipase
MNTETVTRTAPDGTELFTRITTPDSPRATVVLVHGIAEHGGRYDHVVEQYGEAGLAVRVTDLRGFGRSSGARGFVEAFDVYADDLAGDVEAARSAGAPVVLHGHSMGGLISLRYALSDRPAPDLLVLSAPALTADVPRIKRGAAHVLSRLMPRFSLPNDLKGSQLARDPAVGEAYFADELVHPRTTARLGSELFKAMKSARPAAPSLAVPTLVLHGAADTIVPPSASASLGAVPGVERVLMPDLRHEVHNEGPEAVDTAIGWIEEQL